MRSPLSYFSLQPLAFSLFLAFSLQPLAFSANFRTLRPSTTGFGLIPSSSVHIAVIDNYIVGFPTNALLSAVTTVDGSAAGTSTEWSAIDSPGVVTFTPSTGTNVSAAFSAIGSYTIQVTGRKGTFYNTNTFRVFVIEPTIQPPPPDPPPPPPANIPPVVVISAPTNGATFTAPISLTMEATAEDNGGQVTQVVFRDNGTVFATASNSPYLAVLLSATPGSHVLDAIATDNASASTVASVAISVLPTPNVPPTVAITSPTNSQIFNDSTIITLQATATDSDGSVASVAFFNGATSQGAGVFDEGVWSRDIPALTAGTYQLSARSTDNVGQVGVSPSVTIVVLHGTLPNVVPVVAITAPADGATYIAPATIPITASAFDPDGSIASVRFFNGLTLLSTDTTSPYTASMTSVPVGTYAIHADAMDNFGDTISSISINAIVVPNALPIVTLNSPTNGASFLTPVTIPLAATAFDSDGTIVSVKFYSLTLLATDTTAPYTHSIPLADVGNYSFLAVATDDQGATNISGAVSINVSAPAVNILPVVAITAPADGATYIAPATISITATATDADGTIANVKFYNGSTLLGTDTSSPYAGSVSSVPAGTYAIRAEATDNDGAIVSSATINAIVNANAVPVVTVTLPTNNTPFIAPATIAMTATATDSDGTIVSVRFYHGTTLLGTDSSSPFTGSVGSVPAGIYTIRAEATDDLGGIGISPTINAVVTAANQFPSVAFTTPTNGAVFTAPVTFDLVASASDPDGTIVSVVFIDNGSTLSTDTVEPYLVSITPSVGTHLATAKATDNAGSNTTVSVSYTVLPVPNVAPTATLTAPAAGTVFNTGDNISLTATATDSDGTITKVEFFQGSTLLGTDLTSTYGITWSNVPRGNYSLTAVSTDNSGATRASATVLISVVDAAVPLLVNAGPDFTVTLPATADLSSASASGNNISSVTWSKVSGAGTVSFANSAFTNTTATFSVAGSYVLQLLAITAAATNSDTTVITVLPAVVVFPTNSLPVEVAGAQGITETVSVGLQDIVPSDTYQFSMQYHHTLHSTNGFKIQFNNAAPINVNDVTFPPAAREAAFGGHYGACSVIRCTNSGIIGSTFVSSGGLNTIRFIFSDTNSSPAAIRILAFNFQHAGTNMIVAKYFADENPDNWAPVYTNATLIATGRGIWYGTNLTGFQSDGTRGAITAHCTDCHAQDGRDLKYYSYSNKSIVERSKFHGLTQLQGEYVASYIRSLNIPNPGRPWNPPYQPGPGLDTNLLSSWAAGAGISAVLDDDQLTISDLFGSVVTNTVITLTNNANVRQVRIAMQLPDWNHWLPSIHPLDAFGSNAFIASGSKLMTQYDGGGNGAAVGTQYLRNTLVKGSAASLANSKFILAGWVLEGTDSGMPYQVSISPKSSHGTIAAARKAYATALWQLTKMWELHNEFDLQNLAVTAGLFQAAAEPRTQYTKRLYFDASPNILGLSLTNHGINNNSTATFKYFSQAWYQVQLLIDYGNHSPDIFYQTHQTPIDWPYVEGILKDLQNLTPNFPLGGLFTFWKVKEIQANAPTYGPDRWTSGGWNPWTTANPDSLVFSDFEAFWAGTPTATRKLVIEAFLRNWLYENKRWTASKYYTFTNATTAALTTAAYVPVDNRDGVKFGDSIVSSFTPHSGGSYYWNNLGANTGLKIDNTLQNQILDWCKTIWPAKNWTSLYPPSSPALTTNDLSRRFIFYQTDNNCLNTTALYSRLTNVVRRGAAVGFNGIVLKDPNMISLSPNATGLANLTAIKNLANSLGMIIAPYSLSMSEAVSTAPVELREAFPVIDTKFVRSGGTASPVGDPVPVLVNGGFETFSGNQPTGWTVDDPGTVTIIDTSIKHGGAASVRLQNTGINPNKGRVYQDIAVTPFRCYKVGVWVKTSAYTSPGSIKFYVLGNSGNGRILWSNRDGGLGTSTIIGSTQDWTQYVIDINSLEQSSIKLYVMSAANATGLIWMDDVTFTETGLYQTIRRSSTPIVVKAYAGSPTYTEGSDYVVGTESLTIPGGSTISAGASLKVSWYELGNTAELFTVPGTICNPEFFDVLATNASLVNSRMAPTAWAVRANELRVGNWDPSCGNLTMGQYLSNFVHGVEGVINAVNPNIERYFWNDMFDPYHNATTLYFMDKGDLTGSWLGLSGNAIVFNWFNNNSTANMKFWDGLDPSFPKQRNRQIFAVYYDAGSNYAANIDNWFTLAALAEAQGMQGWIGIMYTTWSNGTDGLPGNYDQLENVANYIKSKTPNRWLTGPPF